MPGGNRYLDIGECGGGRNIGGGTDRLGEDVIAKTTSQCGKADLGQPRLRGLC